MKDLPKRKITDTDKKMEAAEDLAHVIDLTQKIQDYIPPHPSLDEAHRNVCLFLKNEAKKHLSVFNTQ